MSDFTPKTPIELQIRKIIFEKFNDPDTIFTNDDVFGILKETADIDSSWIIDDVESFFNDPDSNIRVGITRAGNVIGGGDWAIDRIVPDCMETWAGGETVDIRSPHATRPWQHVLEPLSGYLVLAANLAQSGKNHGEAYNFGPSADQNYPVSKLIDEMSEYWDKIKWNDISSNAGHVHEAGLLKLNCDKSLFDLQWHSALQFEETVKMTVEWYKAYYQNQEQSMYDFTINQIESYTKAAQLKGVSWASDD